MTFKEKLKKRGFPIPTAGSATVLLIITLQGCSIAPSKPYPGYALFEERCKEIAGEKIYRTIENVEGILLINIRTRATKDADSINFPGAAFALESYDDYYIESFLSYEHPPTAPNGKINPKSRGYVNNTYLLKNHINIRGYNFVDVIEPNGVRYRYTLIKDSKPSSVDWMIPSVLRKTPTREPIPRYGVYFEDHVIPSERASGLASTTIKVVDTTTEEVLGEFTAYAYGGAVNASIPNQRVNWLAASKCPQKSGSSHSRTRQFVDQVLIPKQDH